MRLASPCFRRTGCFASGGGHLVEQCLGRLLRLFCRRVRGATCHGHCCNRLNYRLSRGSCTGGVTPLAPRPDRVADSACPRAGCRGRLAERPHSRCDAWRALVNHIWSLPPRPHFLTDGYWCRLHEWLHVVHALARCSLCLAPTHNSRHGEELHRSWRWRRGWGWWSPSAGGVRRARYREQWEHDPALDLLSRWQGACSPW
mmetsp:Transcript_22719/g.69437  ORF Transcript_22719/g.69437 Transcript_22719/m.69437 type:complete len:201 (-) Transcript_22719:3886-4488(-)